MGKLGWMEKPQCEALGAKVICVSDAPPCNLIYVSVSPGDSNICWLIFFRKKHYCDSLGEILALLQFQTTQVSLELHQSKTSKTAVNQPKKTHR